MESAQSGRVASTEKLPPLPSSAPAAFALAILMTGVVAGLGGMTLALLLHHVQHLAYDYGSGHRPTPESFLEGITAAAPLRRIASLTVCGLVAGIGWWALAHFGKPLVSIKQAVGPERHAPSMPPLSTTIHALLQIVTVALGSPLGREVAPREIGALIATKFAALMGLTVEDTRIVIACGAGAGLAAVYNVPLGGAIFVLEVVLINLSPKVLVSALLSSTIASMVAWIGLGNVQQYTVESIDVSASIFAGAALVGPLCGLTAYVFTRMTRWGLSAAQQGWTRIPLSIAVFALIGMSAYWFPQIPGNGKGPAQLGFDGSLSLELAAALLLIKCSAVVLSLRVGAAGGLLTPSFAIGALLATLFAQFWGALVPNSSVEALAICGAAAFLASSLSMPLSAIMLTIEFTRIGHDMWGPLLIAVVGSVAAFGQVGRLAAKSKAKPNIRARGEAVVEGTS
ncbi:chloride channel protein [Rhodoblastus sp.]|uniref:chloride channel protein n=1 Tax=Rhodoblastus sp. TaxID=1962975 RepID=UPI0025E1D313|nr:chloride channel protein [Rhodoblastus sp.]